MHHHAIGVLLLFASATLLHSQEQVPNPAEKLYSPQLTKELVTLRDAALSDDYAYRQVAHLTDNIGPRAVGSPQAKAAVDYVAAELRKVGLEVRLEEVRVPHWMRGIEAAELIDYPAQAAGASQKIVLTALGGTTPTPPDGITAEMVVVDNFDQLAASGRQKVAGKIVLFNELFDKQKAAAGLALEAYGEAVAYRAEGPRRAAELGAIAALVRSVGGADYRLPHTGWSGPAGIPAGIVSGHLDSWDLGTGAIDDAAGVAVAMETAELIQRLHMRPTRTLRVIAWMDEENGGRGHDAYAKMHANEFANYAAVMESDLGAAHPLGFNAKVTATALGWLKPVQNILASFGANIIKQTNHSPGSDIAPMANAGVPALGAPGAPGKRRRHGSYGICAG